MSDKLGKIRILHVAQAAGGVDRYIRMLFKYMDPMIGAIPSRNEVQRELDDLLMSM